MIDPISRYLHQTAGQHGPIMLMYHAITPGKIKPDWPWAVSMQQFRRQLDFLATEGYATPTMAELVNDPNKWMGRTAVITFDDGYIDNLAACEELQKHGMRATWFVVTGSIGESPRWPADGRPAGRLLNAAELREMQACGMEIGSHTVSHVRLTEVNDTRLAQELSDSKSTLEDLLATPIVSFAYPYGAWDARSAAEAKLAGYSGACTTRTGWALRDCNPYQIRRLTIFNSDTRSSLARKLYFGSNDVSWDATARYGIERIRNRIGL
jgi:peptidoglycan/xylan/chitin deacetylase (PgdA/CDA1 family)